MLISNGPNPIDLTMFHPISLCNVALKIVTKVITERLKDLMPRLIEKGQTRFIKGRTTHDNIIILQEVVRRMEKSRKKPGWMIIKVDLAKGYDRINCSFIADTLQQAGFLSDLWSCIIRCITSAMIHVSWNVEASQEFSLQRGIHQGDPLSPYIFELCMDRLSYLILDAVVERKWRLYTYKKARLNILYLKFVDDLLLFAETSNEQAECVTTTMKSFCDSSELDINLRKSASKTVPKPLRRILARKLGIQITESIR